MATLESLKQLLLGDKVAVEHKNKIMWKKAKLPLKSYKIMAKCHKMDQNTHVSLVLRITLSVAMK